MSDESPSAWGEGYAVRNGSNASARAAAATTLRYHRSPDGTFPWFLLTALLVVSDNLSMSHQNRVSSLGEFVDTHFRGTMMGNRGILHDQHGRLGTARWKQNSWVCCLLQFRERQRQVMAPAKYTELFVLDEAVALAAGHRPCSRCRPAQTADFRSKASPPGEPLSFKELDRALHRERIISRTREQRRHDCRFEALPDGAFVFRDNCAWLVAGDTLLRFTFAGYASPLPRPSGHPSVLTPPTTLTALAAGYQPLLHASAESPIT